jgi:hypothetical protein
MISISSAIFTTSVVFSIYQSDGLSSWHHELRLYKRANFIIIHLVCFPATLALNTKISCGWAIQPPRVRESYWRHGKRGRSICFFFLIDYRYVFFFWQRFRNANNDPKLGRRGVTLVIPISGKMFRNAVLACFILWITSETAFQRVPL